MASPDEKADANSASFYALHVALQTLKERCQNLQQRLTTVEDENEILRKTTGLDCPDSVPENNEEYLRGLVGDLVRQKTQLTQHIAMVTNENRQLWSRLSKLTKENSSLGMSITKIKDVINNPTAQGAHGGASKSNNNLVRSKTFTQHTPNPKFRDKCIVDDVGRVGGGGGESREDEENMSLEEISLQLISKLVEGKENFEQKCGEIMETTTTDNLCFGFTGAQSEAGEVTETIDKCTANTSTLKEALLQQQGQLKQLIMSLNDKKKPICDDCMRRHAEKADPSAAAVKSVDAQAKNTDLVNTPERETTPVALNRNKLLPEAMDRMCPMCGKTYGKAEDFEIFQRHVEWHFIDDSNELDLSIDKNYEMISHTVQNF